MTNEERQIYFQCYFLLCYLCMQKISPGQKIKLDMLGSTPKTMVPANQKPSNGREKNSLWNAIQPGDPYDPRQSMIFKITGDTNDLLQKKPQMVCMLQAAEIQRLHHYLSEYRVRYQEQIDQNLDRHSYEIQIKELSQKIKGEQSLKLEILKLNEYISRLSNQNEQLKGNLRKGQKDLSEDYERALSKINALLEENKILKNTNDSQRKTLENYQAQINSLERAHKSQTEQIKKQIQFFQSTSLTTDLKIYQKEFPRLKSQYEKLYNQYSHQTQIINKLRQRNDYLEKRLNDKINQANYYNIKTQSLFEERQTVKKNNINIVKDMDFYIKQNESLKQRNSQIDKQIRQVYQNYRSSQKKVKDLSEQNQKLLAKLTSLHADSKIKSLESEIQRLNIIIRNLNDEKNKHITRVSSLSQQKQSIKKERDLVQVSLTTEKREKENLMRKLYQEGTLTNTRKRQIEYLNRELLKLQRQKNYYPDKIKALEEEIKRLKQEQKQKFEEKDFNEFKQQIIAFFQEKKKISSENRLKVQIIQKQNDHCLKQLYEKQTFQMKSLQIQFEREQNHNKDATQKIKELEGIISKLKCQNTMMSKDLIEKQKEICQMECKYKDAILKLEVLNVHDSWKGKEIEKLYEEIRIMKIKEEGNTKENSMKKQYEEKIQNIEKRWKKYCENEVTIKKEKQIQILVKQKQTLIAELTEIKKNQQQKERKIKSLETQEDSLKQKINDCQKNKKKIEQIKQNYQNQIQELKLKIKEHETQEVLLKKKFQSIIKDLEGQVDSEKKICENLNKKIIELTGRIKELQAEGESIKQKINDCQKNQKKIEQIKQNYQNQIQQLKLKIKEHETQEVLLKKKFQSIIKDLEGQVDSEKKICENLNKKIIELTGRIKELQAEGESIKQKINDCQKNKKKIEQIKQNYQNQIQQLKLKIKEHETQEVLLKKKFQSIIKDLEGQVDSEKKNCENLNKKIIELTGRIKELQAELKNLQLTKPQLLCRQYDAFLYFALINLDQALQQSDKTIKFNSLFNNQLKQQSNYSKHILSNSDMSQIDRILLEDISYFTKYLQHKNPSPVKVQYQNFTSFPLGQQTPDLKTIKEKVPNYESGMEQVSGLLINLHRAINQIKQCRADNVLRIFDARQKSQHQSQQIHTLTQSLNQKLQQINELELQKIKCQQMRDSLKQFYSELQKQTVSVKMVREQFYFNMHTYQFSWLEKIQEQIEEVKDLQIGMNK